MCFLPRHTESLWTKAKLRPALIRIGDRIARLLVRAADRGSAGEEPLDEAVSAALARHRLPLQRLRAIADALVAIEAGAQRVE